MGEETDSERQGEAQGLGPAVALAAASRVRADAFLAEQTELTRLQIEREHKEERLRNWSQFVDYTSAVLKLAFEFVVALIVIVIGVAVVAALWNAAHDKGLVIEAFSVPPDLANRGLTGEVVAGKVLDRLSSLQAQTSSNRAASSYVNNWGSDIKVQIPETGVSIGELYRYLAQWLGHETHISGEIYRDGADLAVTARVGGQPATTIRGSDAELNKLIQQSAEAVYRATQPYRYAVYLDNHGRGAEATAIYKALLTGDSRDDRAWAYIGLASQFSATGKFDRADALLRKALAIKPDILLIYYNLANNEGNLQHDEPQLVYSAKIVELAEHGARDASMDDADTAMVILQSRSALAQGYGDYMASLRFIRQTEALPDDGTRRDNALQNEMSTCGAVHDRACSQGVLESFAPTAAPFAQLSRSTSQQEADLFFGDWNDVVAVSRANVPMLATLPFSQVFLYRGEYPILATAYAELGDFATAQRLIDRTPADCVICLRAHGRIAALGHRWGAAEYWFARAAQAAPSTPFAFGDWGEILLWKGDLEGAIAKFAIAHANGPHFADPLEMWGEALVRLNRSDLALAKFAAGAPYAPNWGRLHLKWGEALLWSGDGAGAARQFATAASLFLMPAERAELSRVVGGHG